MISTRNKRGGALYSVELLLILPIVLGILLAIVEYSLWLAAQGRFAAASREGARVAAVGGSETEISDAVKRSLLVPEAALSELDIQFDIYSDIPNMVPKATGESVGVRVSAPANLIVPDMLRFIGITLANQCILGQTSMRKE